MSSGAVARLVGRPARTCCNRLMLLVPSREYVINEFVSRVPFTDLRLRGYAALGVRFISQRTSNIMLHTHVAAPTGISISPHTIIGRHCILDGRGGINIGANANISSHVQLITAGHDPRSKSFAGYTGPITVGDRVWIATGAMVLAGVTIGEGAVVGAGSLVRTDVAPFTMVAGVPAKMIGERPRDIDYTLLHRRDWL